MAKRYWLMKSEPDVFSIEDLRQKSSEHWDGVRNYQARNYMRDDMKVGDGVLFYHSNAKPPGIAGLAKVVKEAYPDHTALDPRSEYYDPKSTPDDPRWMMVDVGFVEKFPEVVPLSVLQETAGLEAMLVAKKGMRLSVQPVTDEEWRIVCALGRTRAWKQGNSDSNEDSAKTHAKRKPGSSKQTRPAQPGKRAPGAGAGKDQRAKK